MNWFRSRLARVFYLLLAAPLTLAVLTALPQHAAPRPTASEITFGVDPAQSKVHWTLESTVHTVHGTFAFKNGSMQVDTSTGKVTGEIVVDATSGNSGNDGRDKKMHREVLESGKYSDIIFRPDRVAGRISQQGVCSVQMHGVLVLHGSEHELTVPIQGELAGDHWTGTAKFHVPFIDWGLKNPSNFFLKVNHAVEIELEMKGTLQSPSAP